MHPLIIPFFIPHAGCSHTCIFCNQRVLSGVGQTLPDPDQIRYTVEEWLQRSPGRPAEVAFFGGSFSLLALDVQRTLLGAVRIFLDKGSITGVRISTRPDALDYDILTFLQEQGVRTIEVGVQSLDDQVLQRSGRGHTARDAVEAIARVAAAGFSVGAQLLPGLPGDSLQLSLQSVHGAISAGAGFMRFYPVVVLADTPLAALFASGEYTPPNLEQGIRTCARMLHICLKAGIPVVRIGLQADASLQQEDVILAGCWHPALGQLVRSELFYDLICNLTAGCYTAEPVTLVAHPRSFSEVIGNRRHNLQRLQQRGVKVSHVVPDVTLAPDAVILKQREYYRKGNIINSLNYEGVIDA
jgi:histone acetyltransferase (RNA polymerase elongator complex component)